MARLNALFAGGKLVDDAVLADLEEVLFTADIGVRTAQALVEVARDKAKKNELQSADKLKDVLGVTMVDGSWAWNGDWRSRRRGRSCNCSWSVTCSTGYSPGRIGGSSCC